MKSLNDMNLIELRAEAESRVAEGRVGWHNHKTWIRWATQKQLRLYLGRDKAPEDGEPSGAATLANSIYDPPTTEPEPTVEPEPQPQPMVQSVVEPADPVTAQGGLAALGALLGPAIQPYLKQQKVDISVLEEKVRQQMATLDQRVQEKIDSLRPVEKIIAIDRNTGSQNTLTGQHRQFEEFAETLLCSETGVQNVFLVGPAGTGKSYAAKMFAKLLDIPFHLQSCGAGTQEYHFWGHTDANGHYMKTPTYDAFVSEKGAVICIDEIDSSSPDVGLVLNGITNGDRSCFPHPIGCLVRPERLFVIATGNTLNGADDKYGARYEMDGALRNRFAVIHWGHDIQLERELYAKFPEWTKYVQACRDEVDRQRIPYVVSSRNIARGQRMLEGGRTSKVRVEEIQLWGDGCLPKEKVNQVREAVRSNTGLVWG